MTKQAEIDLIYDLGTTKKTGWQQHDNPCLSCDYGDFEQAWKALTRNMSEEDRKALVQEISLAIQAQAIFRRAEREAGEFVPQPKLIASWLRKKRWRDRIESRSELKEDKPVMTVARKLTDKEREETKQKAAVAMAEAREKLR